MQLAWIAGKSAALDDAIVEAAKLVAASRQTLIAGLGTDVAGARAAIALAERTGAIIDHMHSVAILRDLEVARSSGIMLTTPTEAHVHADALLIAGPDMDGALLQQLQRVIGTRQRGADRPSERPTFWLCPGHKSAKAATDIPIKRIGSNPHDLPALLAALRARIGGRPIGDTPVSTKSLDGVANALKKARFAVAIWSAAALDPLAIEMLCGLVSDLNATTRCSTLPIAPQDNAIGVMHACGWMTGFPMRTGFGRGYPRHDPWLFDSSRLLASDEVDCLLWISAYRPVAPPWPAPPGTIALTGPDARFSLPPRIHIAVGCPGRDHDGVQHSASSGALAAIAAVRPSEAISVAGVITKLAAALPGKEIN